jgi:hydroxyethylthiazole kinase
MKKKLIHCLTNKISVNDCANVILAAGASPIMAEHPQEVVGITGDADALYINTGNISDLMMESMKLSVVVAAEAGIPIVVDPAGVGCSTLRSEFVDHILNAHLGSIWVVKCNASEAEALLSGERTSRGVDDESTGIISAGKLAEAISKRYSCIAVISGKVDVVSFGESTVLIEGGDDLMGYVTGTGCMLGAYIAAAVAKRGAVELEEVAAAVEEFAAAGSRAATISKGPGTFKANFIDELYSTDQG